MSLSMEEQRILAEIETRLSEEDPRLAHRLSKAGAKVGRARRRRIRLIAAVAVAGLAVLTAVAAAVLTAIS
ncbi:hypothetical protein Arub01_46370 [Actinomadura rubrobrunea]|uniref:DUF3040 domain-containing protein n=1 Tax=Actinomadura rubrobrunea TaxID=115335 RepID=A0A9W6UXR0_9ACTN|nr:DUF3040 domain-containing protein [Actinomadura rubrobrunea]GLW66393.1 hypothetical protein Arub01_46370 [Actinomadura rubrobrunea]